MGNVRQFIQSEKFNFGLRLLIGVIILLATVPKLMDIEKNSVYLVYSYRIFPMYPVNIARELGIIVPYIELVTGIGLIFGLFTRLALAGWAAMSLAYFAIKIHIIFIQGIVIPCGCFPGILPDMLVTQSIWIDVFSLFACVRLIISGNGKRFLNLRSILPERWRQSRIAYIW